MRSEGTAGRVYALGLGSLQAERRDMQASEGKWRPNDHEKDTPQRSSTVPGANPP